MRSEARYAKRVDAVMARVRSQDDRVEPCSSRRFATSSMVPHRTNRTGRRPDCRHLSTGIAELELTPCTPWLVLQNFLDSACKAAGRDASGSRGNRNMGCHEVVATQFRSHRFSLLLAPIAPSRMGST